MPLRGSDWPWDVHARASSSGCALRVRKSLKHCWAGTRDEVPSPKCRAKLSRNFKQGLRCGRWKRAKDAGQWFEQRQGVSLGVEGVRQLAKKAGSPQVPALDPHSRRGEAVKRSPARKLLNSNIPAGQGVRVWAIDEHRYGLISHQRRCWGMRRCRPRAPYRTRYEWGYLARALEIEGKDEAVFVFLPCVEQSSQRRLPASPGRHRCAVHPCCDPGSGRVPSQAPGRGRAAQCAPVVTASL